MQEIERVGAGALPRIAVCPASYAESKGKLNPGGPPAQLGKAFHAAMAQATEHGRDAVDIVAVAAAFGTDAGELAKLWQRFDFDPVGGEAEVKIEVPDPEGRFVIRGILDWVKADPTRDGVYDLADWKTTHRVDDDPEPWNDPQTKTYAVGFLAQRADATEVRTFKAYPRRGSDGWSAAYQIDREGAEIVRAEMLAIAREAVAQLELPQEKRRFNLSHFCGYCPGRVSCPAIALETKAMANAIRELPILKKDGTPGKRTTTVIDIEITAENAPRLHELRKLLKKGVDALAEQIRVFVDSMGPIEVEPGKYLAVMPTEKRASLSEELLRRAGAELGLSAEVSRILAWRDEQPRVTEQRMDIYSEESLSGE